MSTSASAPMSTSTSPGIIAVSRSENAKLGTVAATYVAQQSCPVSCILRGSGCYAETGATGFHTRRINRAALATKMTVRQLARNEARAIDGLAGSLPLRLHVVGDSTTNEAASMVSQSAARYRARGGSPVWAYTHSWRTVRRTSWGKVSVLASCESTEDARLAMSLGYGAAIVVDRHAGDKAAMRDGLRLVPCPQQTGRARDCVSCGLCFHADRLRDAGTVIAFEAHGGRSKKVVEKLVQIQMF